MPAEPTRPPAVLVVWPDESVNCGESAPTRSRTETMATRGTGMRRGTARAAGAPAGAAHVGVVDRRRGVEGVDVGAQRGRGVRVIDEPAGAQVELHARPRAQLDQAAH